MAKRDEILRLYDLADRKGYDVTQSTMRDHVWLIDGHDNLVRNKDDRAAQARIRRGSLKMAHALVSKRYRGRCASPYHNRR